MPKGMPPKKMPTEPDADDRGRYPKSKSSPKKLPPFLKKGK